MPFPLPRLALASLLLQRLTTHNYHIFQEGPYKEIQKRIEPFIDKFPLCCLNLNPPIADTKRKAWTCWWQGEARAPEIVRVCWKSQKKYLPANVEHVIITEENYKNIENLHTLTKSFKISVLDE